MNGQCGKNRYPHERAAKEAADLQMEYARERGETLELRTYRCPNCGGWHLTESRQHLR